MLDIPMQIGKPNGVRSSDWLGDFITVSKGIRSYKSKGT